MQAIMQIIANRISLLMYDPRAARRLRLGVGLTLAVINISVFCVWLPARLQINETWIQANNIWDRCEKGIFLLIDLGLNLYFVYLVQSRLVKGGLEKYRVLFHFNCAMLLVSISMDVGLT